MDNRVIYFIKVFAKRLLISFAVVFGLVFLFIIYPRQSIERTITSHIKSVQSVDDSLQKARQRLKDIPNPSKLTPANNDARSYANSLAEAKGAFGATVPAVPSTISNKDRSIRIANFNSIIKDPAYRSVLSQSSGVLDSDKALFNHQASVMLALANLLEYNPAIDLASSDKNTLANNLQAAQGGLQITLDRLEKVPKYDRDKTVSELTSMVSQVQAGREKLATSAGSGDYKQQKQEFIDLVHSVQSEIISNRSKFWATESDLLFNATNKVEKILRVYLTRLQHI